jgi:hypothetical protein
MGLPLSSSACTGALRVQRTLQNSARDERNSWTGARPGGYGTLARKSATAWPISAGESSWMKCCPHGDLLLVAPGAAELALTTH